MKKFLLVSLFLVALLNGQAQPSPTPAPESADAILSAALQEAARDHKNVFIIFHASWCGWCHRMDTAMNDPLCKKFFQDNFVIRHLVVLESKDKVQLENPGAEAMRLKYHGKDQGIPFWLIFDKDGKLLADSKIRKAGQGPEEGQNSGCPAAEQEVAYFIDVLKQTSRLSPGQEEIIRKRFRANER
jgi:thioredoxin-related protein